MTDEKRPFSMEEAIHMGIAHKMIVIPIEDGEQLITPKRVVEMLLESKPSDDWAALTTLIVGTRTFGPFLEDNAISWLEKNREIVDNAIEDGEFGMMFEGHKMDNADGPTTVNTEKPRLMN